MTALSQELLALPHGRVSTAPRGLVGWGEGAKCLGEEQAQLESSYLITSQCV